MQLSLLDGVTNGGRERAVPPAGPCAWAGARRVELGDGAWLEVVRRWVPHQAALFERAQASADWELHERQMYERVVAVPRLVAACPGTGPGPAWTGETAVRVLPHRATSAGVAETAGRLRELAAAVSARYERRLPSISLAYYRDGNDSVAFHGDRLGPLRPDTVVAILSLGAPRRFLLRRAPSASARALPEALLRAGIGVAFGRASARPVFALSVGEGDLLVMGGSCQETWEHGVPKQTDVGPRIAVMFRERWDEEDGGMRNIRGPVSVRAGRSGPPAPRWRSVE